MKSLVIGGTGQLGANLVRALLGCGDQVRVLHRSTSNTFTIDGLDIERVVGDLNDGESLRLGCEGRDVVYHTAGYYPSVTIPVELAKRQALKETALVLEAVRVARVDRLVFASTLTTVGFPKTVGHPANETCQFSTRYTNNPYLMAKAAMEEEILQSAKQGIPTVVVIPTEFFGPYDQQPSSGTHILMVAKGRMPVYVPGRVNVIDVRDVAVAMIRAAERGRVGERYLVGNWNTTQKDLKRTYCWGGWSITSFISCSVGSCPMGIKSRGVGFSFTLTPASVLACVCGGSDGPHAALRLLKSSARVGLSAECSPRGD